MIYAAGIVAFLTGIAVGALSYQYSYSVDMRNAHDAAFNEGFEHGRSKGYKEGLRDSLKLKQRRAS